MSSLMRSPLWAERLSITRCWSPSRPRTHESLGGDLSGDRHLPGGSQPFVSLHRPQSPFFRLKPSFLSSRFTVESLRVLPVVRSRKRRLSETVAAGRSFTSSSRSFSVIWSVFSGLLPPFLGDSETPR